MHYSTLAVIAATGAAAAPLGLGNLDGLVNGLPLVGQLATPLLSAVSEAGGAANVLNIVFNIAKNPTDALSSVTSLSVLNGAGDTVLGQTCANKLVDDAFSKMPIDFSNVGVDGLGSFDVAGVTHKVGEVTQGVPGLSCVKQVTEGLAAVHCVVPKVEEVVLNPVGDVTRAANCFAGKIPVAGGLVQDVEGKIGSLPVFSGLAILSKIPGVSEVVSLLSL